MSPSVKRGLQVAKELLRHEIACGNREWIASDADILDAVKWIAHQEAIDAKRRRRPRHLIPPGTRHPPG